MRVAIVYEDKVSRGRLADLVKSLVECECVGVYPAGDEAFEALPEFLPELILLMVKMPDLAGIESYGKLKALLPRVRILVVMVHKDGGEMRKILSAGASGYIVGEGLELQLAHAIAGEIAGERARLPLIALNAVESFGRPPDGGALPQLTRRENEILGFLAEGLLNKEIASRIDISVETVRFHLRHVYEKLDVCNRTEAVLRYMGRSS